MRTSSRPTTLAILIIATAMVTFLFGSTAWSQVSGLPDPGSDDPGQVKRTIGNERRADHLRMERTKPERETRSCIKDNIPEAISRRWPPKHHHDAGNDDPDQARAKPFFYGARWLYESELCVRFMVDFWAPFRGADKTDMPAWQQPGLRNATTPLPVDTSASTAAFQPLLRGIGSAGSAEPDGSEPRNYPRESRTRASGQSRSASTAILADPGVTRVAESLDAWLDRMLEDESQSQAGMILRGPTVDSDHGGDSPIEMSLPRQSPVNIFPSIFEIEIRINNRLLHSFGIASPPAASQED